MIIKVDFVFAKNRVCMYVCVRERERERDEKERRKICEEQEKNANKWAQLNATTGIFHE